MHCYCMKLGARRREAMDKHLCFSEDIKATIENCTSKATEQNRENN